MLNEISSDDKGTENRHLGEVILNTIGILLLLGLWKSVELLVGLFSWLFGWL